MLRHKLMLYLKRPVTSLILIGLALSIAAPIGFFIIHAIFHAHLPAGERDLELAYLYIGFATATAFVVLGYFLGRKFEIIQNKSLHDELTGLANRNFLIKELVHVQICSEEMQKHFSIIMIDLDEFRRINDRFGHSVGDKTLRAVATVIREIIRPSDFAVRYGSDEFVVVCPETDQEKAFSLAERLRQAIQHIPPSELGFEGKQTVTVNVLEVPIQYHLQLTQILSQVDGIMHEHKNRKHNTVTINQIQYALQKSTPIRKTSHIKK